MQLKSFEEKMSKEWAMLFKPFIESKEMNAIYAALKIHSKTNTIYPLSSDTFQAFKLVKPKDVKLIVIGEEPFCGMFHQTQLPQADGLCLSNGYAGKIIMPDLIAFLKSLSKYFDLPYEDYFKINNLSFLAEQGILLLNKSLTVNRNKIDSHKGLWDPFYKFFFEKIMKDLNNIPIIVLGENLIKISNYSAPIIELKSPSFYSDRDEDMLFPNKCLDEIDDYLREYKGVAIKWSHVVWKENKNNPLFSTHLLPF